MFLMLLMVDVDAFFPIDFGNSCKNFNLLLKQFGNK